MLKCMVGVESNSERDEESESGKACLGGVRRADVRGKKRRKEKE